MSETAATLHSTRTLSPFAADLRYGDLPNEVVKRTEEFFLDWAASALAGRGETSDGDSFTSRVDVPKGDPENTLSREELEEKAHKLADHGDGATPEELRRLVDRAWNLANEDDLRDLLPERTDNTRLRAYGAKRRNGSW
jgi:2-methylcitrate dehydratase PrpD